MARDESGARTDQHVESARREEYADGDHRPPTHKEILSDLLWYLAIPLCLFFGIGAVVNIGLLVHMHVAEIGIYTRFELVDDKWIYYASTAIYTVMFGALCWFLSTETPETTVILR